MNIRIVLIISLFAIVSFFSCNSANTQDKPSEINETNITASKTSGSNAITAKDVKAKQKASAERRDELLKRAEAQKAESVKQQSRQKAGDAMNDNPRKIQQPSEKYPFDVRLADKNGKEYNSKKVIGNKKPTAILFWLTTCPPCKKEMAAIKTKYATWEEELDFDLIAVSMDWERNHEKFRTMAKEKDWPWKTYIDLELAFKKIMPGRLNGLPQSFVFDSKGEIVYHKKKYVPGDEDKLFAALKSAR